jgi:hypothetical protein
MLSQEEVRSLTLVAVPNATVKITMSGVAMWVDIDIAERFFTIQITTNQGVGASELYGSATDAFWGHDVAFTMLRRSTDLCK